MSMNTPTLDKVAELAQEVATMARAVRRAQDVQAQAVKQWDKERERGHLGAFPNVGPSPKDTGTLRRRSMDLTRALAEMRRS